MLLLLAGAIFTFLIIGGIFQWLGGIFPQEKPTGYITLKECGVPDLKKDSEKKIIRYIKEVNVPLITFWWGSLDQETKDGLSAEITNAFQERINEKRGFFSKSFDIDIEYRV